MTLQEFLSRAKALHSIDFPDLQIAGIQISSAQWLSFRENPLSFLAMIDDRTAEKIWALMEKRSPQRQELTDGRS